MAQNQFIQRAIKRPGRMKRGAKRAGMSTHAYMEKEKHSSDPSMRSAANLGLRLEGMHHGGVSGMAARRAKKGY